MNKNECLKMIRQAKHSTRLLVSLIGNHPGVAHVVIKWPDVVDAYVAEDDVQFREDVGVLMCHPIKVIVCALAEKVGKNPRTRLAIFLAESIMKSKAKEDPLAAKANLINLCNELIREMPVEHRISEIKELEND